MRAQPLQPPGATTDGPPSGATMRVVIAGFAFDLNRDEVEKLMSGVEPEHAYGDLVDIGRNVYPVKQVGEAISGQNRRDFSSREVTRALGRLGFAVRTAE